MIHTHINKLTQKQYHTTEHWKSHFLPQFLPLEHQWLTHRCCTNTDTDSNTQTLKQVHTKKISRNQTLKIAILPHFCRSNISGWQTLYKQTQTVRHTHTHTRETKTISHNLMLRIAILPQFLPIEHYFVQRGATERWRHWSELHTPRSKRRTHWDRVLQWILIYMSAEYVFSKQPIDVK